MHGKHLRPVFGIYSGYLGVEPVYLKLIPGPEERKTKATADSEFFITYIISTADVLRLVVIAI